MAASRYADVARWMRSARASFGRSHAHGAQRVAARAALELDPRACVGPDDERIAVADARPLRPVAEAALAGSGGAPPRPAGLGGEHVAERRGEVVALVDPGELTLARPPGQRGGGQPHAVGEELLEAAGLHGRRT